MAFKQLQVRFFLVNRPKKKTLLTGPGSDSGASSKENLPKNINSLESLLDSRVYSVSQIEEVDAFVTSPLITMYDFGPCPNGTASLYMNYCTKLQEIKCECIEILRRSTERRNMKKPLNRVHDNVLFCLENLGIYGALQASRVLLSGDHSERLELVEEEGSSSEFSFCNKYLSQVSEFLISECKKGFVCSENNLFSESVGDRVSDLSSLDILKEPFFSRKLLCLVGILSSFRPPSDMKCIVFVNGTVTARFLSYILQQFKILARWKSEFFVGVHAGVKNVSRKTMNMILDEFCCGEEPLE